jgi:hypothetical protein
MRYLIFVLIMFLFLSSPSFGQSNQYYISPGRGVEGLVYLGQDMGKMFDAWGTSDTIQEGYGVLLYDYKRYLLGFATEIYSNKVVIIFVNTNLYRTVNNLGVGSSLSEVIQVYGSQYRLQNETAMGGNAIFYDSHGIGFGINNNVVVSVAVYFQQ